jgi:hypothetical protein
MSSVWREVDHGKSLRFTILSNKEGSMRSRSTQEVAASAKAVFVIEVNAG